MGHPILIRELIIACLKTVTRSSWLMWGLRCAFSLDPVQISQLSMCRIVSLVLAFSFVDTDSLLTYVCGLLMDRERNLKCTIRCGMINEAEAPCGAYDVAWTPKNPLYTVKKVWMGRFPGICSLASVNNFQQLKRRPYPKRGEQNCHLVSMEP